MAHLKSLLDRPINAINFRVVKVAKNVMVVNYAIEVQFLVTIVDLVNDMWLKTIADRPEIRYGGFPGGKFIRQAVSHPIMMQIFMINESEPAQMGEVFSLASTHILENDGYAGIPAKRSDGGVLWDFNVVGIVKSYFGDHYVGALQRFKSTLSDIRAENGGIGGFLSFLQCAAHVDRLPFHRLVLAMGEPRESAGKRRQQGGVEDVPNEPPIGRRLGFIWLTGLGLFPCCCYGTRLRERGRSIAGRLLIGAGFAAFWGSLILGFLTGFSWSWGWPL